MLRRMNPFWLSIVISAVIGLLGTVSLHDRVLSADLADVVASVREGGGAALILGIIGQAIENYVQGPDLKEE